MRIVWRKHNSPRSNSPDPFLTAMHLDNSLTWFGITASTRRRESCGPDKEADALHQAAVNMKGSGKVAISPTHS